MKREAIHFSGGKDSLAVLYMLRDRLSEIAVYFGDTGAIYPHMREFVVRTCDKLDAELRIVRPAYDIDEFHRVNGYPSDIVPIDATAEMGQFTKHRPVARLQSNLSCCSTMLWWPLQNAMLNDGITTVYRGSKAQDHRVGVPDGFIQGGITYRSPLWDWSDDQVFSYIDAQGAELAEHYGSVNASMDCWNCTAYLNDQNAAAKLQWTRARYPDLWPELSHRLRRVADTISAETQRVQGALGMAKFDKSVEHVDP